MTLRYALLGLLAAKPGTGYALKKRFGQSLANVWSAETSQIYPELARLEQDGLIKGSTRGPRRSKTYSVTAAGLREVKRWLSDVEPNRSSRNEVLLRVFFFFLLDKEEATRLLNEEIEFHQELLARYKAIDQELRTSSDLGDQFGRIVLDWGLRYEPAFMEWLEWAAAQARRALRAEERRSKTRPSSRAAAKTAP
jgi:DNA-binding PadR family transcriptional regulator